MTDRPTEHPSDEIPGGLWLSLWKPTIVDLDDPLRLDDPLGLGLAGLAARVAERLQRRDLAVVADVRAVCRAVQEAPWSRPTPTWAPVATISWAASYLALTDRLCAVAGLGLEPGEVATWNGGPAVWVLATRAGAVTFGPKMSTTYYADLDTDDPIKALRTAARAEEVARG